MLAAASVEQLKKDAEERAEMMKAFNARPMIHIHTDGRTFRYVEDEKDVACQIKNTAHLKALVAKAIENGKAAKLEIKVLVNGEDASDYYGAMMAGWKASIDDAKHVFSQVGYHNLSVR